MALGRRKRKRGPTNLRWRKDPKYCKLGGQTLRAMPLVVVPKTASDTTPKINMIEIVSPEQKLAFDLLDIKLS